MPELNKEQIKALLQRYAAGECTPEEKAQVESWYYKKRTGLPTETEMMADLEEVWQIVQPQTSVRRLWPRIAVAASILIALSIGGYELIHKPAQQQIAQNKTNDIAPGSNKAILTLANGQKISVTDAKNGIIAKQAGIQVTKTQNGNLVYIVNSQAASGSANSGTNEVAYNTISTPRGGQTHVALPDGTIAYLDAASSMKFPIAFNGKERKVEITGQVYFEVVHNAKQPFKVVTANETIEDIGTHFNVNAYYDEPAIKTTLIEGSIRVQNKILIPNQQLILKGDQVTIKTVDPDAVLDWKNGNFTFDGEKIQTIMRRVARWYDVTIEYQGAVPSETYEGTISRYSNVSEVLKRLQQTQTVHFKIDGRRIIVMK